MADHTLSKQEYLTKLPATVPTGLVLVHNSVRPAKRLGTRGFRAWLDQPSERYVTCACGWARELGTHYRVDRFTRNSSRSTRRSRHSLARSVPAIAASVGATARAPMKTPARPGHD